jgi:NitT/TauT family transport system substrate-binding protein
MMSKALALALVVVAIGCQRAAPKATVAPRPIRIACTLQPQGVLVQVAAANGYFKAEGLEADLRVMAYGKVALQALLDHQVDVATVAETPIMFAAMRDEPFYVIANIEASSRNNAIVARRDAGIARVHDLEGKRVAFTPGTTSEFFLDSLLTAAGLPRSAVRPVPLQPEEMVLAIQARTIDAACTWNYSLARIRRQLGENAVLFFDQEIYTETFNLAAAQDIVLKEPETVKRFLRALVRAEAFVAKRPQDAQRIMATATRTDLELVQDVWDAFNYVVRLDQTLLITLEDEARWAMKNGMTGRKTTPDFRRIIHPDCLKAVKAESGRETW